jgi:HSP20 family protein
MNNIVRFDPFAEIDALQKQLFGGNWLAPSKSTGVPTTDVYVDKDKLVVEAHLPNFTDEDISVEVEHDFLVVQAERHEKEEDKAKKYVVRESSMSFYRRIQLPERANAEQIDAHLDEGVLKVTVPLTPLPEPKKVKILTKKTTSK